MSGYATALGANLNSVWADALLAIEMFTNSAYFWPGVAASIVIIYLGTRLLLK